MSNPLARLPEYIREDLRKAESDWTASSVEQDQRRRELEAALRSYQQAERATKGLETVLHNHEKRAKNWLIANPESPKV